MSAEVLKTTDYQQLKELDSIIQEQNRKVDVDIELEAKLGKNLSIKVSDGINTVVSTNTNNKGNRYNISGQRVGQNYKGVIIKNGRKSFISPSVASFPRRISAAIVVQAGCLGLFSRLSRNFA
jgi:hypothetical protein